MRRSPEGGTRSDGIRIMCMVFRWPIWILSDEVPDRDVLGIQAPRCHQSCASTGCPCGRFRFDLE
eukprot:6034953-Pyramimonas_sp.AAC.1